MAIYPRGQKITFTQTSAHSTHSRVVCCTWRAYGDALGPWVTTQEQTGVNYWHTCHTLGDSALGSQYCDSVADAHVCTWDRAPWALGPVKLVCVTVKALLQTPWKAGMDMRLLSDLHICSGTYTWTLHTEMCTQTCIYTYHTHGNMHMCPHNHTINSSKTRDHWVSLISCIGPDSACGIT